MREPNKKRTHINYLRKFRRARGLKAKDVTAILGLRSASTLSRWENGVTLPDSISLMRLAALYRTFVDALFPEVARDLRRELRTHEHDLQTPAWALRDAPRQIDIESTRVKSNIESISRTGRNQ